MSVQFPLASSSWDQEEADAIQGVIASGMYSMGENVRSFERDFAKYTSSEYCVMVNSGSSANLLMVAALFYTKDDGRRLQRGDEVIVPAVSWSTTYYPLYQYGLKLKFVDVDLQTLNYDMEQLEQAVSDSTRLIMAVNLLGNPNDFTRIEQIIGRRNITLIEDNCESMGAQYAGKQTGTFGLMGSFSAFFSHHISTMEGGMIVTADEELYQILLALRAHGWTRNLPKKNLVCSDKSDDPFEESFRFVLPGYNVRPLEMSGAIGVAQVKKLPAMVANRRRNAEKFLALIARYPEITPQKEVGASSWFGFSMIINDDAPFQRHHLVDALNRHGVDVRPIVAGNFAKNEVLKWMDHTIFGALKNAETIDRSGLFVGNHHYVLGGEFTALENALDDIRI